jgi:glyoxylase-like metal-dependent hydrolase (beta-lactamase superfamily II)
VTAGVWHLTGQSHHSVLVEFPEYLVLIEAPQNDTRTLAVIEQARELQPEKPLRYVINTHHHFDHSGGMRAAVSEGLTVITHELNRPFFEDIVARQHTIVQDALATNPQPLAIETVPGDDRYVLEAGRQSLEIYPILNSPHADTLLMVYLPRERLLVEADVFSPGAREAPFAANLLENIEQGSLRVDRVVPIHGSVVPFSELEEVVMAGRPSQ